MIDFEAPQTENEGPDVTPLMDAVFILLLFFVLASAFTVAAIDVELPPAQSARTVSGKMVEIRLSKEGDFTVDGVRTERRDMPERLQRVVHALHLEGGRLVMVSDPQAPVEALVYAVDLVKRTGGETLLIAAEPLKH